METDYDVVVAGGGMIGTSFALALAPLGLRVAVVEAVARAAAEQPSFDERSTALSRSSQRMFTAMGLWDEIKAAATPIHNIHVSEKGRFGFSHIDAEEQGVEALGYVVINRVLGEVLQAALEKQETVDLICPARITAVKSGEQKSVVRVDQEGSTRKLSCRLVVAADGARSSVREMLGISAQHRDYGQHAIVGNVLTEKAHANRAFERFTEAGPLAMLPIADDRAAFVWIVQSAEVENVLAMDDAEFTERLQEGFGLRLGRFSKVGVRAAYPLGLSKANGLVVKRGVLIGNAAHGLHPVAAQGFNLGLRDVAALSDCIADARVGADVDPGSHCILEEYADWRRADQGKLVQFTDGIVRLFGSNVPAVRTLRNIGMLGFDVIPGVRTLFAKHTMGLAGKLPRLSRGLPLT
ncbi:MAG: 2-octaprenyl-6-methoxyphenyl hydroxylase [Gammaproteobacteria bacterium]|nr:2-octaprenyl-6-methoxyphenyl hydroxylase [Gammaproteobacteria bacterium]